MADLRAGLDEKALRQTAFHWHDRGAIDDGATVLVVASRKTVGASRRTAEADILAMLWETRECERKENEKPCDASKAISVQQVLIAEESDAHSNLSFRRELRRTLFLRELFPPSSIATTTHSTNLVLRSTMSA